MEQEVHQWMVHPYEEEEEEEMMEDGALIRRESVSHSKGSLITDEVTSSSSSSSSSPSSNGSEHSNGVCSVVTAPDGSPVQKEEEVAEMGDGGENNNHVNGDEVDCAAVGLAQVAEFAGAETNGEAISGVAVSQNKNGVCVYFDKQQGMWKCHHCTWTKRFDSPWTVPNWNIKSYPDLMMNVKTMIQHGPCFVCETKDDEANGLNGVPNGDAFGSVHPTNLGERAIDVKADQSVIQNNSLCSEITNHYMKTMDDKLPSVPELSHIHNSSDIQATAVMNFHEETSTKEEAPNLIKEIDQQLEEFDVEAVLAKQETHDLFCPNCHSCITKRVILKKRKRNIHKLDNKAKRDKLENIQNLENKAEHDKLEIIGGSELVNSSAQPVADQGGHANGTNDIVSSEPPADNNQPNEEPEVFRCLSCFSFFIPSGKCLDLFRKSGGARKNESAQDPSSTPASNLQNPSNRQGSSTNWLTYLFPLNKGKKASDASPEDSRTCPTERHHSTSITSDEPTSDKIGHPKGSLGDTSVIKNVKPMLVIDDGHGGMNSLISATNDWSPIQSFKKSDGDLINGGVPRVGQDFVDFSVKEQLLPGNMVINEGEKNNASADIMQTDIVEVMSSESISDEKVSKFESVPLAAATTTETIVKAGETTKETILKPYEREPAFLASTTVGSLVLPESMKVVDKTPEIQSSYSPLGQGAQSPIQSSGNAILANDVASNKQYSGIEAIFPSKPDFTLIDKEIKSSSRKENAGGDVIVVVEREAFKSTTSQTADNIPVEGVTITASRTQVQIVEQPRDEVSEPQGWEVLKSVVYGGLVESITSLGVVSSAVSSGATPLNIIALGFANIVGGLFILGHNLIDLKNDHPRGDQTQMNTQDRYQEFLGRRANFLLHVVVAVLSFLIFGAVPLVIYGVLINKNYYTEVKLAAVAASSAVCIILLAIGKVYSSRPPRSYIKTVLYYVTLALAASGVSYIGGNLFKDLLEKHNHSSEPGFAITMPIADTSMESAWMSY
ncbi:Membrane protein of ER body-like protein, partial [Mucuna pruriens]